MTDQRSKNDEEKKELKMKITQLKQKLKENTKKRADDGALKLGEKLAEYILMQRLFPPQQRAVLLRGGKVEGSGDSV